jgi:hypothetical protein
MTGCWMKRLRLSGMKKSGHGSQALSSLPG